MQRAHNIKWKVLPFAGNIDAVQPNYWFGCMNKEQADIKSKWSYDVRSEWTSGARHLSNFANENDM